MSILIVLLLLTVPGYFLTLLLPRVSGFFKRAALSIVLSVALEVVVSYLLAVFNSAYLMFFLPCVGMITLPCATTVAPARAARAAESSEEESATITSPDIRCAVSVARALAMQSATASAPSRHLHGTH